MLFWAEIGIFNIIIINIAIKRNGKKPFQQILRLGMKRKIKKKKKKKKKKRKINE